MSAQYVADAMQRVEVVLRRRPDMGVHDDSPAIATLARQHAHRHQHANGIEIATDMPGELGGTGDQVTPGWLLRAGLASCTATRIAMSAAAARHRADEAGAACHEPFRHTRHAGHDRSRRHADQRRAAATCSCT